MGGAATVSYNLPTRSRRPSGTGVQVTITGGSAWACPARLLLPVSDTLGRRTWYDGNLTRVSDTLSRRSHTRSVIVTTRDAA